MGTAFAPVRVERLQGDLSNSDRATAQTVAKMCKHIHDGAKDPLVKRAALAAVNRFKLPGASACRKVAWAAWWLVKHCTKFVHDESLFNSAQRLFDGRTVIVPGNNELEMLVAPTFLVRADRPQGDCDDFTMILCSLLEALHCPWEIVTVEADPRAPGEYSHVYCVAVLEDGTRLPLDASHGSGPGWEVPAEHTIRYQAWDESGRPVKRERSYKGLHGYTRRAKGVRRRATLRGLGDGDSTDATIGYPFQEFPPSDNYTPTGVFVGPGLSTSGSSGSGGSGSSWDSFFQGLTTQGLNLVGKIVAPTATYVRGPNGQLMISAPAGANVNPFATVPGISGGGSSWLLIGGLLIGGVVLVSALGKK